MSAMGFQKKSLDGAGGWGELHPSLFWIFGIFLTLQSPLSEDALRNTTTRPTDRAEAFVVGDTVHAHRIVWTRVTNAIVNVDLTVVTREPFDAVTRVVVRGRRGRETTRAVVTTRDEGARVVHLQ